MGLNNPRVAVIPIMGEFTGGGLPKYLAVGFTDLLKLSDEVSRAILLLRHSKEGLATITTRLIDAQVYSEPPDETRLLRLHERSEANERRRAARNGDSE